MQSACYQTNTAPAQIATRGFVQLITPLRHNLKLVVINIYNIRIIISM